METISIVLDITSPFSGEENNIAIKPLLTIVQSLLEKKLYAESKDEIALVICGSCETENPLYTDGNNYKHIKIDRELGRVNWEFIESFQKLKTDKFEECDLLEAVTVGADHLVTLTRGRRNLGRKRIIVISNLEGEIDWSSMEKITEGLRSEMIELDVISRRELPEDENDEMSDGNSTDDERNFFKGTKMSPAVLFNEKMFSNVVTNTGGASYSFDDAMLALTYFTVRSTLQRAWKVNLEISDVFSISLAGFVKVREVKPSSSKQVYGGDPDAEIEIQTTHYLNNEENTEIDAEQIIKGFKFGRSVIPCTEEDIASMKLNVEKSMKLIGFTEGENIGPELFVGNGAMFFEAGNPEHVATLTALIHAMYEAGLVAIVRRVYSKATSPKLGVLSPKIKDDSAVFVYREVAFGEDIRQFTFPRLPGPPINSGIKVESSLNNTQSSTNHRNTLTEEELSLANQLIDGLLLVELGEPKDEQFVQHSDQENDKPGTSNSDSAEMRELYKPSRIINPAIQLIFESIGVRYSSPSQPMPSAELIEKLKVDLEPPKESIKKLEREKLFDKMYEAFKLKIRESVLAKQAKTKVAAEMFPDNEANVKKRKLNDGNAQPNSIVDLSDILGNRDRGGILDDDVMEVGSITPIEDFHALLQRDELSLALQSMENRVTQLVRDSYMTTLYPRALECMREMRKQALEYTIRGDGLVNLVAEFNDFLRRIKQQLLAIAIINKKDFWDAVLKEKISLITKNETDYGVEENEKVEFENDKLTEKGDEFGDANMDDLFDDM